ncbi:MAG: elongation factor P [Verrucomicrobia bacterium]|nr:elongation factor P [Verrucomicrobiota bacterium]
MYNASDLKKGLKIEIDGDPCVISDFQFSKPGKGQAIYRCKIKNLSTGSSFDKSYRSGDKVKRAALESRDFTFSYHNGDDFVFSDNESFEEIHLTTEQLGDNQYFISEDMQVEILFHNNKALDVTLPNFVEKEITDTEPGARGDTTTNCLKPAFINNGYEVSVPIFINIGDIIRIDTRTGEYADRVSKG